ncbi:hypothetical protein ACFVG1_22215 [Streptomyces bacillaris]|uniref:hypothetical protein n=1 Tax=Streptomyces bacillaris TaxID=68179 RepID=UPI0035D5A9E2
MSRYLNGTRLAPWEFILELVRDVASHRGDSIQGETLELLRTQHRAAAEAQGAPSNLLRIAQDELAEADKKAQKSSLQIRILTDALHDRETLLSDVELQLRQVQQQDALRDIDLGNLTEERDALLEERAKLRNEISSLKNELGKATSRARKLEEECSTLERKLATLEDPHTHELPSGSMAFGMLQISNFTRLTGRLEEAPLKRLIETLGIICQRASLETGVRFLFARSSDVVFTGASAITTANAALMVSEAIKEEVDEYNPNTSFGTPNIGLCYGQILSTNGVLYGLTVSRAESLCAMASRGQVLSSDQFVEQVNLEKREPGNQESIIAVQPMWKRPVKGLGVISPWIISRAEQA